MQQIDAQTFFEQAASVGLLAEVQDKATAKIDAERADLAIQLKALLDTHVDAIAEPTKQLVTLREKYEVARAAADKAAAAVNSVASELQGIEHRLSMRVDRLRCRLESLAPPEIWHTWCAVRLMRCMVQTREPDSDLVRWMEVQERGLENLPFKAQTAAQIAAYCASTLAEARSKAEGAVGGKLIEDALARV